MVHNLEWLRGNTPSSLCAGTGGNNERLLLMPGNPINLGVFVRAGAKEFSVEPDTSGTQACLGPQYPLRGRVVLGVWVRGPDSVADCGVLTCVMGAWSSPTSSPRGGQSSVWANV